MKRAGDRLGLPFRHPAALIATGAGTGLLPWAPGSWASLVALPIGWAIHNQWGVAGLAIAAGTAFGGGWWATIRVARASGAKDPGFIVIDEVAAQWLTLLAAPQTLLFYALAFLLFRLFDIFKPWPVRRVDREVPGGLGIMLDDIAAAVYALLVILAARALLDV